MKNKLQHEWMAQRTAALLLCGLLCMGGANVYADTPRESVEAVQQSHAVKGTVLDEMGEPVPGANIFVKGNTSVGTISDIDGMFSLNVPSKNAVLIVSFIGYKSAEVPVNGQANLRVTLEPEAEQLSEVVVTALGIKREKKALGYAMQEVKTDALQENKSLSVANMLQGKVAGVQISQSGGGMGGATRVVMRGLNSLSGNNQPLWVVDGVPINDGVQDAPTQYGGTDISGAASQINPEDIESISVLKGANAAALYGSRAQSGAIVITTKKGKQGQPLEIEYNGNLEFSTIYSPYEYQNVYGQGSNGVFSTSAQGSWGPKMEGQMVDHWRKTIYGDTNYDKVALLPQEDYIEQFYETGTMMTNSITATAGSEFLTGRVSFTDSRNDGITPNHSIDRQYYDMNTEFKNKWLTVGAKINFMREKRKNSPGQGEYGLMKHLIYIPRGIRMVDLATDNINSDNRVINWSGASDMYTNPYQQIMSVNGNTNVRNRLIGQMNAAVRFTDYLTLTGRVGIDWYQNNWKNGSLYLPHGSGTSNQYSSSRSSNQEFNADLILNFNKQFGDFSVTANLGTSVYNVTYEGLTGSAGSMEIPGWLVMGNGDNRDVSESYSKKEIQSVFGNASVGWKSMLYLDVTGRNDWSSTLPAANRSYFYPSVSMSAIISEMVKLPEVIDYLKVRGSWAMVGNDTNPYQLAYVYSDFTSAVNGSTVLEMKLPDTYPLRDLKPEETKSYEFGLDLRMFKNRLGVDFTYYNSTTTDQILTINTPATSGFTGKIINAGKMKSHGIELMITGTPIQTKDWQWDLSLNWGTNTTECVELDSSISRHTLGSTRICSVVVENGGKFGDIVATNAFKRDEAGNILVDEEGLPLKETDKIIGNMLPDWTGSIGTTLRWKDVVFSALVDMRMGGDFISMTDNYATESGNSVRSLYGRDGMVVDGIVESTGQKNTKEVTAEQYWSHVGGSSGIAEEFMYDGTYVKLREMSLGWNLPKKWLQKTPLKAVKVSAVARDLFYFYKDAPVSAESALSRSDYMQAFEFGSTPPTRTFGVSLNVKF
ncbi:MAG: SusC/RagA family TonB-linked outer membrane protein [Bacteroides sp.]|nr:SusC/RagA family TonB-linked outer membrane protein [Bacteroides sp.]